MRSDEDEHPDPVSRDRAHALRDCERDRTPPKRAEGGVLSKPRGVVVTVIVALLALVWLFPLLWALVNSFREYDYTQANGYLSFGGLDHVATTRRRGRAATSGCT